MARPPKRPDRPSGPKSQIDWSEPLANVFDRAARTAAGRWRRQLEEWALQMATGAAAAARDAPATSAGDDPYVALGCLRGLTLEEYEDIFRARAKRLHPDKGGSEEHMAKLNWAIGEIRKSFGTAP